MVSPDDRCSVRFLRSLGVVTITATVLAACGGLADPVVTTDEEVLDAVLALEDGASVRATAELELDQDELRDALRDDAEARELLQRLVDAGSTDVDELVATLAELEEELSAHAVVLQTAADGSGRLAAEYRDEVWLDLRARPAAADADTGTDDETVVDLQARVDWSTVATLLERPGLRAELDEAVAELTPFLDALPDTAAAEEVLLGLLGGELVGISGAVGDRLLEELAGLGELAGHRGELAITELDLELEPREVLETALAFDGFRRDGDDTLVDVTLELRAIGEELLDRAAAADPAARPPAETLEAARDELAMLPERLTDVATLTIGPDADLRQVRVDVLDVVLQTARAVDLDDPELAASERVAGALDATGLFVLLDVEATSDLPTVLGDPSATATPAEVATAVRAVLFGRLANGLLDALEQP